MLMNVYATCHMPHATCHMLNAKANVKVKMTFDIRHWSLCFAAGCSILLVQRERKRKRKAKTAAKANEERRRKVLRLRLFGKWQGGWCTVRLVDVAGACWYLTNGRLVLCPVIKDARADIMRAACGS